MVIAEQVRERFRRESPVEMANKTHNVPALSVCNYDQRMVAAWNMTNETHLSERKPMPWETASEIIFQLGRKRDEFSRKLPFISVRSHLPIALEEFNYLARMNVVLSVGGNRAAEERQSNQ